MANRKITVLNPAGYQEIFQSGDNLLVDGNVDVQSNGLTGVPLPTQNTDAANKQYTDSGDAANAASITANTASISTNTSNIATNTNNISTNTDNITINTGNISTNTTEISGLDSRLGTVEINASNNVSGSSNQISFQGTQGISFPAESHFTLNQLVNSTITVQGPDLSSYLQEPSTDGTYIIAKSGTEITYSDVIDGGIY